MSGLNKVTEGDASLSTLSQAWLPPSGLCFSPCSPVPEIPVDSFLSRCISPPSLTLPPAHLLGFDLQDLNNHEIVDFFFFFNFLKGISPAKHAKVMPTSCSLIPAKENASYWEEGERGAGGSDPPVCDILTDLILAQPHL